MKCLLNFLFLLVSGTVFGQNAAPPTMLDTSKMTYNYFSQKMGVIAFPSKNQAKPQQKQDEFACYQWAIEQTGFDPMNPPKADSVPMSTGPTGAGVGGAAKGAAAGAAIGSISGDMGKGAAYGAIIGGVAGRRQGKMAQANANQQAANKASASQKEMNDQFKKAFSVCMEAKGYTIK